MRKMLAVFLGLAALASSAGLGVVPAGPEPEPFSKLRILLEQNATDGDAEVVLFAKGQDEGLAELSAFAPSRKRILHVKAQEGSKLGLREFHLETAEPKLKDVSAAFPRGATAS